MSVNKRLPVKLDRDLIKDSVVEIRFVPTLPRERVIPAIFEAVYRDFPFYKEVNVLPLEVRATEPFKYAITTLLYNNDFSIGFASNCIVFNCVNGYKGWNHYFEVITRYLHVFFSINIFSEIERIGLRYVNVFTNTSDLSKHILLDINFNGIQNYTSLHTSLNLQLTKNDCQFNLNIADTALINNIPGSLLDIDVVKSNLGPGKFENICAQIEQVHFEEKELFINILHPDFLKSLGPTY